MAHFVGLRLYDGADGVRRLDAILKEGVVRLVLAGEDEARPVGWYDMAWVPVADPSAS